MYRWYESIDSLTFKLLIPKMPKFLVRSIVTNNSPTNDCDYVVIFHFATSRLLLWSTSNPSIPEIAKFWSSQSDDPNSFMIWRLRSCRGFTYRDFSILCIDDIERPFTFVLPIPKIAKLSLDNQRSRSLLDQRLWSFCEFLIASSKHFGFAKIRYLLTTNKCVTSLRLNNSKHFGSFWMDLESRS